MRHTEAMEWSDVCAVELMFDGRPTIRHVCGQDGISTILQNVVDELENVGPCTVIVTCKDRVRVYGGTKHWPMSPSTFLSKWVEYEK